AYRTILVSGKAAWMAVSVVGLDGAFSAQAAIPSPPNNMRLSKRLTRDIVHSLSETASDTPREGNWKTSGMSRPILSEGMFLPGQRYKKSDGVSRVQYTASTSQTGKETR